MSRSAHHVRLLWCAATDSTFSRVEVRGSRCIVGKCVHCNTKLSLGLSGQPGPRTTLEHIVPRTHGGTNALANLALACGRCNGQKGRTLDVLRLDDPALQQVIATLQARRRERWREPPEDWHLPPMPADTLDPERRARDQKRSDDDPEAPRRGRRGRRGRKGRQGPKGRRR